MIFSLLRLLHPKFIWRVMRFIWLLTGIALCWLILGHKLFRKEGACGCVHKACERCRYDEVTYYCGRHNPDGGLGY